MSKRNTPQRRHAILALLNEQGEVSVDELSRRFETSEVTIRKDLAALEKNGLLLRRTGTYVMVVSGWAMLTDESATFAFAMREAEQRAGEVLTGTPLALGETASGTLGAAGTPDSYLVTLTERTRIMLDGQTNTNRTWMEIHDPWGRLAGGRALNTLLDTDIPRDDIVYDSWQINLPPGTYRLDVGSLDAAAPYNLQLLDLDAGPRLVRGTPQVLLFDPATRAHAVTFTASAGERLAFEISESEGVADRPRLMILGPEGQRITYSHYTHFVDFGVPTDGVYTLIIDG